ncbi:hypothetical protein V8D89_002322 [Ganoderma adspersum]
MDVIEVLEVEFFKVKITSIASSPIMNVPFCTCPGTSLSFSGQFTSCIVPIVLHCIVTCPLSISTIAPTVLPSLLSRTPLFPLMFPLLRQWRNLKAWKQSGVRYEDFMDPHLGSLAVVCPACPRPGVNLKNGWQSDPEKYKYMASMIMDGNFSAEHQGMKNPWDDVRLADGHVFMVTNEPYKAHLKMAVTFHQKLECHEHHARAALESTGIGAAACSHHGFFFLHCVVNVQNGEGQRNIDYCMFQTSEFLRGLLMIYVMYNVWCHYCMHMVLRFEKSPSLSMLDGLTVLGGIGQFHLEEVIESLWPAPNKISDSTRGMTTGHQQEVIDNHLNDSNWHKLITLASALAQKWRLACQECQPAHDALKALMDTSDPAKVCQWTLAAEQAAQDHNNDIKVMDIYAVQAHKLPSCQQIQLQLSKTENGSAAWISYGLKIKKTKLQVASKARAVSEHSPVGNKITLEQMWGKVLNEVKAFHHKAAKFLPATALVNALSLPADSSNLGSNWDSLDPVSTISSSSDVPEEELQDPPDLQSTSQSSTERIIIALLSSLGIRFCKSHSLQDLVEVEKQLHIGQMNDTLHSVHVGIGYKSFLYRHSVRKATLQRQKLKSFDEVHMADAGVLDNARLYTAARTAFMALFNHDDAEDMDKQESYARRYKILVKADMKANTAIIEHRTCGLSKVHLLWFWTLDVEGDLGSSEWMDEMYRVVWLQAHAQVAIVPLEMSRSLWAFKRESKICALRAESSGSPGHRSWATRQTMEKLRAGTRHTAGKWRVHGGQYGGILQAQPSQVDQQLVEMVF